VPPHLPLVLFVILALECFVVFHTVAPVTAPWATLVIAGLATSAMAVLYPLTVKPSKPWVLPCFVAEAVGIVFGEAIAYFVAVPWQLTWICWTRSQHDVEATMFLRFITRVSPERGPTFRVGIGTFFVRFNAATIYSS